ncbi:MAG: hypothetical protein AB8G23_24390 [Myxococcota bacterium]
MSTRSQSNTLVLTVAAVSAMAVPFAWAMANLSFMHDSPVAALVGGVIGLVLPAVTAWWFVFRHQRPEIAKDPFLYLFTVFAFAAILDLLIGLNLLGLHDWMSWYFSSGEPYLNTPHGMAINLWDGFVHYGLYLFMISAMANGRTFRRAALFWAGSMCGSGLVFLVGNFVGEFSEHVEVSYLLNVPFMMVPLFLAWRYFETPEIDTEMYSVSNAALRFVLTLGFLSFALFSLFRLIAVLNPSVGMAQGWLTVEPYLLSVQKYPLMQMIAYAAWLMPFCVLLSRAVYKGVSGRMLNWLWIFFGALCQGQWAYLVAATSGGLIGQEVPASGSVPLMILVNLAPVLLFGALLSQCRKPTSLAAA